MGSTDVKVRERQLNKAESRLAARAALLEGKGLDAAAAAKDPLLRKLKAELHRARKRVEAPKAAQAHVEKVAAKIAKEGKPKPTEKKGKGKPAKGDKGGGKGDKGGGKGDKGGGKGDKGGGKGDKKK